MSVFKNYSTEDLRSYRPVRPTSIQGTSVVYLIRIETMHIWNYSMSLSMELLLYKCRVLWKIKKTLCRRRWSGSYGPLVFPESFLQNPSIKILRKRNICGLRENFCLDEYLHERQKTEGRTTCLVSRWGEIARSLQGLLNIFKMSCKRDEHWGQVC